MEYLPLFRPCRAEWILWRIPPFSSDSRRLHMQLCPITPLLLIDSSFNIILRLFNVHDCAPNGLGDILFSVHLH